MIERQSRLLTFRLDHDYGWDDGLVCGGIMDVAVQVIASPQALDPLRPILNDANANRQATLAIDVMDEQQQPAHFEIHIAPTPRLLIAGAGHVGQALARIAGPIDFRVTVLDDRAELRHGRAIPGGSVHRRRYRAGAVALQH